MAYDLLSWYRNQELFKTKKYEQDNFHFHLFVYDGDNSVINLLQ